MQDAAMGATEVGDRPTMSERLFPVPTSEQLAADLGALAVIEGELGALDVALGRLDDGSYWTCEACGHAIDEADLTEAPLRRRCARCAPPSGGATPDPAPAAATDPAPIAPPGRDDAPPGPS